MKLQKKEPLTSFLPPTPCTAAMREQVVRIAAETNRSIADIQRTALTLFLAENVNNSNKDVNDTKEASS